MIRKISKRTAKRNREYRRLAASILRGGVLCGVCKCRDADQLHHIKPRSVAPKLVCVEENLLPICVTCHDRVHRYPAWARGAGFLKLSTDP
jgi:5-methylcytosine-specific restriction endonuclease McrA